MRSQAVLRCRILDRVSLRIGIFGTGRLGGLVADACADRPGVDLVWAVGRTADLSSLDDVDVALDVSHADAVADHLAWAEEHDVPLVIGTTGWSPELLTTGEHHPATMIAPNFSLSLALLRRLTAVIGRYASADSRAARGVDRADLAVFDRHHHAKVDSPSGTALLLARTLGEAAGDRGPEVQIAAQRLGDTVGFHEVRYTDGRETLTLSHEAHDRTVFARGALLALQWLHDHRADRGVHTFDEVADDLLSPLWHDTPTPKGADDER